MQSGLSLGSGRFSHAEGPVLGRYRGIVSTERGDLDHVLGQFERVDTNLAKLERVWAAMRSADRAEHEELIRSFGSLLPGLPAVDGFSIEAVPMSKTETELLEFEANEVGEPEAWIHAQDEIEAPGRQIAEYRVRLNRARKEVVRERVIEVVAEIDSMVGPVGKFVDAQPTTAEWEHLSIRVAELDRLVARAVPGSARWTDLRRHLYFGADVDLRDIIHMDWPSVRAEVERHLYDDHEPLPVSVDDLGEMVRSRPRGPVSTRLRWDKLNDEDFESIVFELVRTADGYENTNWLMQSHAPDRGRDLETYRVVTDVLSGTNRSRVIVQCKHWLNRSLSVKDLVVCVETVQLWAPPLVEVLIVATSGRFTQDAVAWIEKRRNDRTLPIVEPWPESHIETLIARRPGIAARFGLR